MSRILSGPNPQRHIAQQSVTVQAADFLQDTLTVVNLQQNKQIQSYGAAPINLEYKYIMRVTSNL